MALCYFGSYRVYVTQPGFVKDGKGYSIVVKTLFGLKDIAMAWVHLRCVWLDEDNTTIGREVLEKILVLGERYGFGLRVDTIMFMVDKTLLEKFVHDKEGIRTIVSRKAWKWMLNEILEMVKVSWEKDCLTT